MQTTPNSDQAAEPRYTRPDGLNNIQQLRFIPKHFVSNLPTLEHTEHCNILIEI